MKDEDGNLLFLGMGIGNKSQGKLYWKKAVEYKLKNQFTQDVIGLSSFLNREQWRVIRFPYENTVSDRNEVHYT